jgi:hypothetical protein
MKTTLRTAAWGTSALLMVGAVAGTATAAAHKNHKKGHAATSDDGSRPAPPKLLHDLATVQTADGSIEEHAGQFGEISAISATSITVVSADDYSATYAIDGDTVVVKKGKQATTEDLAEGDKVFVRAEKTDGGYTAEVIGKGKPPARHPGGPGGSRPPIGPGGPGGPGGFGMGAPDGPGAPGASGGDADDA